MRPRDNEAKISAVQAVAWRRLGSAGRLRVAADMSDDTRRIAVERIKKLHPEMSDDDVLRTLARAFGGSDDERPSERSMRIQSIALEEALGRFVEALEAAGVVYMLTGSLASTAHGVPRATTDLDVVIDPTPDALEALLAELAQDGWTVDRGEAAARRALAARTQFVVTDDATTWKIDVVVKKNRAFSITEFDRRERMEVLGIPAWVASAEDTIIAKLEFSKHSAEATRRAQQRKDIAGVVASRGAELDREYVERWVGELDLVDEWIQAAKTP